MSVGFIDVDAALTPIGVRDGRDILANRGADQLGKLIASVF